MESHAPAGRPHAKDLKAGPQGAPPKGDFMSQTGGLSPATKIPLLKRVLKKELLPIMPLFLAVGAGVSLAAWSAHRQLTQVPEVSARLNKDRRANEVPEIDSPEMMAEKGKQYLENTMIRDTIRKPFFEPILRFMTIPSGSKAEEDGLHAQVKEKSGKMTLETGKGRVQG